MRARSLAYVFIAVLLIGAGFYAGAYVMSVGASLQTSGEDRIDDLEVRVTLLEATVEAMANNGDASPLETHGNRTITGEYIERPEVIVGDKCTTFYDPGTTVFLSDWDGEVLGTGELGEGKVVEGNLCSQSFSFDDVPEKPGYVVNFERRAIGSAYEFTAEEVEGSGWHIEVVSRYRN